MYNVIKGKRIRIRFCYRNSELQLRLIDLHKVKTKEEET